MSVRVRSAMTQTSPRLEVKVKVIQRYLQVQEPVQELVASETGVQMLVSMCQRRLRAVPRIPTHQLWLHEA